MEILAKVSNVFWRFHFYPALFVAVLLTFFFPFFFGIANTTFSQCAEIYERFFPLIGLILFLPLYLPDGNVDTLVLIKTKRFSYVKILLLRFIQILISLFLLTCSCLILFDQSNAQIEFDWFLFSGIADVLFMGGLNAIGFAFTRQTITGLVLPIGYYVASMFAGEKYLKIFYLFSLVEKDGTSKLVLLMSGLLLIGTSFVISSRNK